MIICKRAIIILMITVIGFSSCATGDFNDEGDSKKDSLVQAKHGNVQLVARPAKKEALEKALATGKPKDLRSRKLTIRLYEIPVPGSCVPKTKFVCAHQYILTVSKRNDTNSFKVYDLGQVGEITRSRLVDDRKVNQTSIAFMVANYPRRVLQKHQALLSKTAENLLQVTETSVTIKAVK